jgi:hypothetical protein
MKHREEFLAATFTFAAAFLATTARAADALPSQPLVDQASEQTAPPEGDPKLPELDDSWQFKLAPYLWVPALDGDITIKGNSASVNYSVGDTFDAITDNFNFGLALRGEASHKEWSFLVDIMYLSLEVEDVPLPSDSASVRQDQGIFELAAAYELTSGSSSSDSAELPKFKFAPLAGVRVIYLSLELDPSGPAEFSGEKYWGDAFVGFRTSVSFTESFSIFARADIGAGGSSFTWNALAGVEFRFNTWGSLLAGYRGLDIDYSEGSGADEFAYDMLMHGPFVGLEVRF